jgi:hypothetical protein
MSLARSWFDESTSNRSSGDGVHPIDKHVGYIDNYMHDGLMALFGLGDGS